MKRCPTCGNTYTNDRLVFCLEDGATLVSVSDSQQSFDPEATLRISAEERPPSVEAFRPPAAPTIRAAPATVPYRQPPDTSGSNSAPAASPSSRSTSPVVVAGITAIVVLLLVIAGIGVALLVRNSSSESSSNVSSENRNAAQNRDSSRNSSSTSNDSAASRTDNSSNRSSSNEANRNGSANMSAGERAEAKVVRGTPLDESDLATLSREEMRRLRNAVYARHGRTFDSVDLQRYFDSRPWYKPRYDYNESDLTQTDRANIQLIQTIEAR